MHENVKEYLEWAKERINEAIPKVEKDLRDKFMLSVEDVLRGGKRFRPALTLLSAQAIAGDDAWQKAIDYAIAVEMIHSFSLNIDDILDMDEIRRGKPSEWVVFGLIPAFLTGIGGITQAFSLGSKNHKAMKVLNETIQAMASGAVKEMVSGNVARRDLLLNIITLKTGALMATATQMGAIAVNAPSSIEEAFRKYGLNIGIAYQMQDDLNDIFESMKDFKPHGDLRDFRMTMPLYIIHENVPSLKDVIDLFVARKIDFESFMQRFSSAGMNLFPLINNEIENYADRAILYIKDLTLHEKYKSILTDLPYYMIDAMKQESLQEIKQMTKEKAKEKKESIKSEEVKEKTKEIPYDEWLKTLSPTLIAATTLLQTGMSDEDVVSKTDITDKELTYIKEMLAKYGKISGED